MELELTASRNKYGTLRPALLSVAHMYMNASEAREWYESLEWKMTNINIIMNITNKRYIIVQQSEISIIDSMM